MMKYQTPLIENSVKFANKITPAIVILKHQKGVSRETKINSVKNRNLHNRSLYDRNLHIEGFHNRSRLAVVLYT